MKNKGFTLLELLVVVLIIGILAGIALPQYQKSVEKAKLSEALTNLKTLEGALERFILSGAYADNSIYLDDMVLDVELSDGEFNDEGDYITKNFNYSADLYHQDYTIFAYRGDKYQLQISNSSDGRPHYGCGAMGTEIGKYICKYLESQGWEYDNYEW